MPNYRKMTDEEFVLHILKDGQPHAGEEIMQLSIARRGVRLTLHSRVASLRDDGWEIASKKIKGSRDFAYWIVAKHDRPVRVRTLKQSATAVTAYIFKTDGDHQMNGKLCEIMGRADPDPEALEPAFKVRFFRGQEDVVWSSELSPWYPSG